MNEEASDKFSFKTGNVSISTEARNSNPTANPTTISISVRSAERNEGNFTRLWNN